MASQKPGHMKYEEWIKHWSDDDAPFHVDEPDEILVKKEADILGNGSKRVFVPLCGKVVDIKWMYDRGHTVIGVEISERAVADFFKEQKLESEVENIENVGNRYQTKDQRIQLYAADVFRINTNIVGVFDVIWDSAGLSVINKDDRPRYFELIKSLMKPETKYYVNGSDYDKSVWPGPPHPLNVAELTSICGDIFHIEEIHKMDMSDHCQHESTPRKPEEQKPVEKEKEEGKSIDCFSRIEEAILKSPYMHFTYHCLTLK